MLTDGKSFTPRTREQQAAVERFNDVMITIKFGLDQDQIGGLSQDYYDDLLLINNMRDTKKSKK